MLGGRGGEGAADLAVQGTSGPEPACLVEEVGHLRGHAAKPCANPDDDGVIVGQVLDSGDGGRLIELVVGGLGDLFWHEVGDPLDVHLDARFQGTLGHGLGHGFDMAIGRIVKDQNLGHGTLL